MIVKVRKKKLEKMHLYFYILTMYDAIVIGGGPSGSTISRKLAEAGYDILLLEKEVMPRYKVCAGGVPSIIEDMLTVDLSPIKEKEIKTIILRKGKKESKITFDAPVLFTVRRDFFDSYLLDLAFRQGVEVKYEKAIKITGRIVITDKSSYEGKVIIGADGAASIVRKNVFTPERWLKSVEAEIDGDWDNTVFIDVFSHFGYRWIMPKRGRISAGAGGLSRYVKNLEDMLYALLNEMHIKGLPSIYHYGYPIWFSPKSLVRDNIILVGDAGGLANPFSGAGIFTGIFSALIGAYSVDNFLKSSAPLEQYDYLLKAFIYPELKAAFRLAIPFYLLPVSFTPFSWIKNTAKYWGKYSGYITIRKKLWRGI